MPACSKPHAYSFSVTSQKATKTLLLAQSVVKNTSLVKIHHGFSCDNSSQTALINCRTEKSSCW